MKIAVTIVRIIRTAYQIISLLRVKSRQELSKPFYPTIGRNIVVFAGLTVSVITAVFADFYHVMANFYHSDSPLYK